MVEWFKASVLKADVVYSYRGFESLLIQIQYLMFLYKLKLYFRIVGRITFMLRLVVICIFFSTTIINDYETLLFILSMRLNDLITGFFDLGVNNEWFFLCDLIDLLFGINRVSRLGTYPINLIKHGGDSFLELDSFCHAIIGDPGSTNGSGSSNISVGVDNNNGATASDNSSAGANNTHNNSSTSSSNNNNNQNNGVNAINNNVSGASNNHANNGSPVNINAVANNGININPDQEFIENLDPNDPLQNLMVRNGQVPVPRPNNNFDENDPNVLFDITPSILNATDYIEISEDEEEGEESD